MNRRGFLKLFGGVTGGVIATATMAEAGALAEFLSWAQRSPSWSFATPLSVKEKSIREFIRMSEIVHNGQTYPLEFPMVVIPGLSGARNILNLREPLRQFSGGGDGHSFIIF